MNLIVRVHVSYRMCGVNALVPVLSPVGGALSPFKGALCGLLRVRQRCATNDCLCKYRCFSSGTISCMLWMVAEPLPVCLCGGVGTLAVAIRTPSSVHQDGDVWVTPAREHMVCSKWAGGIS